MSTRVPLRLGKMRTLMATPLTSLTLAGAAALLARRDADLGRIFRRHGPPPLWARPAGFATLVRIILEQQVSLASAAAVYRRLGRGLGRVNSATVAAAGENRLRLLGVTRQKASYLVLLGRAVEGGDLDIAALSRLPDQEARATLQRLKGIGAWSADIYLLMALRRPDVWPAGDLALAAAAHAVKGLRRRPSPDRLARLADPWRPWRSVAARMLWQHYLSDRSDG